MLILGIVLLILGLIFAIHWLVILGFIIGIIGLLMLLLAAGGTSVGGRRYWY